MKKFLVGFWFFSISVSALATEARFTTLDRFGVTADWNEAQGQFPQVLSGLKRQGTLSMARIEPIESIHPYRLRSGLRVNRPSQIDDLLYESLMLPDPVGNTEIMYPLIAKAVRFPDDLSYAIFELDPRVRFQDGTAVSGADIVFSFSQLKASSPDMQKRIEDSIQTVIANDQEVRFNFITTGEASRDILMLLAGMKIVKPNSTGADMIGGIPVEFTATGPYRITQLGKSGLSLIIDPLYWATELPIRQGFFNFRVVEVVVFADELRARQALVSNNTNFLFENQPNMANEIESYLNSQNHQMRRLDENGTYFMDWRLNVPNSLPAGRIHMYGYWEEGNTTEQPPDWQDNPPTWWNDCQNLACVFDQD